MALRKPSDYFKKDVPSLDNSVQKLVETPELSSFSQAFDSFKNNLGNIEVLSEKVKEIQTEIETLLKKEDLDRAMTAQLLVLEQSIRDVQGKVHGINENKLKEIRSDVSELTESVNEFLEVEVPKYKKLVVKSELRTSNRFTQLEDNVNQTLEGIGEFVDNKYQELTETLQGINEQSLAGILEDFKLLGNIVQEFKEQEIPKYKGLIVETERKTENKLNEFNTNLEDKLNSFESDFIAQLEENNSVLVDNVKQLNQQLTQVKEQDIPKYKGFIVEAERKTENKLNEFREKLDETVSNILEKVNLVEGDKDNLVNIINQKIEDVSQLSNQVKITEQNTEDYKEIIKKKVSDLEINILRNETHINVQNKNLEAIQEEVKEALEKINLQEIKKQNHKLANKIKYLEEVFEKFSEKEILTENIIVEPSSTDNKDPLTPLNQNFVTLDQLQQHYRLFINRVQQQLASLGGGGETRLKYLDDVVGIATNPSAYDGKFLRYDYSSDTFEFQTVGEDLLNISEENIVYVAKDGKDTNDGTLGRPKLTIKNAVESVVAAGKTDVVIRVAPGTYIENNPITLPDEITVIGHSLRETTVIPQNDDQDLFYIGNGNYVAEMSFRGSMPGKAVFAFDPVDQRYIIQSPYIQNCTNFIPDSIGMRVDGKDAIGPLKSMVLDSYTQYNQGGIGVSITNEAYAQLVSLFTICDDIAVYVGSGGGCDLTNSNSSFGNYGLVADGVSGKKYTGIVTVAAAEQNDTYVVNLSTPTLNVVDADYNNQTGRITVVTNEPHKFNVGMAVTLAGLGFTCDFEPGIREYPSGKNGYVFNVETVAPGRYLDASNLIQANRQEIIDNSYAAINVAYPSFVNPDPDKCKRDIGYIVDAISSDVREYTSKNTIEATKKYFKYDGSDLISNGILGEVPQTIVGFTSARELIKLAITNNLTVKDLTIVADPITGSNTDPSSCSDVRSFVDNLVGIITTRLDAGNLLGINALPNVSLASTIFTVDVGIATQPHYYNSGGQVKINLVRPYDGQSLYFNELYYSVKTLNIIDGGSGYTELPTVTIEEPDTPWGIRAQAIPILENGVLIGVDMLSNGRGYRIAPKVTISAGINTAVATSELTPEYYTIQKATEIVNDISIITLNEVVPYEVGIGTEVQFFKQSRILATGHSFEFIGSGTDIANCLPFSGGIPPIPENETDARSGGLVVYSSTNQAGNFKIGDGVIINQNTGSISGQSYSKSLLSSMTPYILSLGGF